MKYCSVDCQKVDFNNHKRHCRVINKLTTATEAFAEELRNETYDGEPLNYFESEFTVGRFWGLVDTREYCWTRSQLAHQICEMGRAVHKEGSGPKPIIECGLAHYLDLLRLVHSDNQGLRNKVPFILLYLNREEDAYNFIKWWETIDPDGHYDWGEPPKAKEGDWLYLTSQDVFEDLFSVAAKDDQYMNVTFLIALALIKSKIVEKWEVARERFAAFEDAVLKSGVPHGQQLCQTDLVTDKIKEFVFPFSAKVPFPRKITLGDLYVQMGGGGGGGL